MSLHLRIPRAIVIAVFSLAATTLWGAGFSTFLPSTAGEREKALGTISQESQTFQKLLAPDADFPPLARPGPGDWLASHRERGQSFRSFQLSNANRPDATRRIIYLQPLGVFSGDGSPAVEALREYAAIFFQMEVKILPAYAPAEDEFSPRLNPYSKNRQLLTHDIMAFLLKRLPSDAYCLIGVTMADLYPQPSWNFVFGQASLSDRTGVFGFARYDPEFYGEERPDSAADLKKLILRRSCHTLVHEIAHMFGLWHCIYYKCVLNGSNSLRESDTQPQYACPVCLRKLHDAIGFVPMQRYKELEAFYTKHGWSEEAAWTRWQLAKAE